MNGFIGALAAQLALKPVSPAADGIAPRPRRPVAECLRAQRTARAKLTAPSRRSAYLQQLRRVWWADSAAVRMRARVAAARPRPSRSRARAVTTLRRVASQQPMAPAPQVGRTSMRRRTQRTARASVPALSSRRCPPPQLGTAASRGWARAGYGGNEHATPCAAEGWLCWRYAAAVRHRAVGHGGICPRIVFPGGQRIATCARNALSAVRRRQGAREMHSQAPGGGDMLTLCVPGCLTMAIFCPGVSQKSLGREKGPFVAMYRRRVFKMSWLWQDMRAMHPKSPANRRWRIHHVNILPGRGPFRCTNPSNHARRADLATIQRSQGLANGRQEEPGIASALRIAADGPTTVVAHICGSRAQPRQLPLCGRWRKPMTVSAAASEQCSGAYARPALRHPPARSNFRCWRFSAAARPMTVACPHGASCSTAAARTSTVGGALPST